MSVAQRQGVPFIDVDYVIVDPDSTNVTTAVVGFIQGIMDLDHLIPMSTIVDGTHTNLGAGIVPGRTYRVTWDPSVDTTTNVLDVAISVLANDGSQEIGLHWLTLPGEGRAPDLTINRSPITEDEILPAYFWWIASEHPGLVLVNGVVKADGGTYDDQTLLDGTGIKAAGVGFAFEQLGHRRGPGAVACIGCHVLCGTFHPDRAGKRLGWCAGLV